MTSATADRESVPRLHRLEPATFRPPLRTAKDRLASLEPVSLGMEGRQQLVLRALVERFGGEVTSSVLARHLSRQWGRSTSALEPRLADVLHYLNRLGALSLEEVGDSDVIVRLLPDGAELYL